MIGHDWSRTYRNPLAITVDLGIQSTFYWLLVLKDETDDTVLWRVYGWSDNDEESIPDPREALRELLELPFTEESHERN
jgi:hypothetical protein